MTLLHGFDKRYTETFTVAQINTKLFFLMGWREGQLICDTLRYTYSYGVNIKHSMSA